MNKCKNSLNNLNKYRIVLENKENKWYRHKDR
jgi:hypothetical protein